MGTTFEIVLHRDDARLAPLAVHRLADLERRWSRFLPDSEISVLNRHAGRPVIVSADTFAVIAAALDGSVATGGRFDPTVHDAMCALGYRSDLAGLPDRVVADDPVPAPGVDGIERDEAIRAVTLPPGVALDLGGIGKGAAADLASGDLLAAGARGAAVAVGGDVRVRGASPTGGGWSPGGHGHDARLPAIADGGVCTTSVRRRRWTTTRGEVHHIVDPRTGAPATTGIETVTVIGATARQAEILAKAALLADDDAPELLAGFGVTAVVTRTRAA